MTIILYTGEVKFFHGKVSITISNGRFVIKYRNKVETFRIDLVKEIRVKGENK